MRWRSVACISILCSATLVAHADVRTATFKTSAQITSPSSQTSQDTFAQEFAFALRYRTSAPSRTARLMVPFQNAARFVGSKLLRLR